jgi:nitrate reductase cytochrome c-type subunit
VLIQCVHGCEATGLPAACQSDGYEADGVPRAVPGNVHAVRGDYLNQVFTDMNRCIECKGWKQVRSQQEQMREAITSELAQTGQPAPRSDSKATESFVRGVEERLARSSNLAR